MSETFETETGFVREHRPALIVCAVVAVMAMLVFVFVRGSGKQTARRVQELTMVQIQTPPPPPPPPQKLPEPKMIEQPKMVTPEVKQEHVDETKPAAPVATGPLGLDAKPDGAGDSFNLAGNAGGNGLLGGGGGSRWGWYASMVQEQIAAALRDNPKTRRARFNVQISIWANPQGHVERVRLDSSTGDPSLDKVLQDEVFPRLALKEAPPPDMPMPIVMRNVAQRPG